jgi:hypothetical protein
VLNRWWRVAVPGAVAVGLVAMTVPAALAGELDNDPLNNKLKVKMTLTCQSHTKVRLDWTAVSPTVAFSMTAKWYDVKTDAGLAHPTPATQAAQYAAVVRSGDKAKGTFTITGHRDGHRIALFVDALDGPGGSGRQVYGLGRNIDKIDC